MPATNTPSKTVGTSLLALQSIATATAVISSPVDVSTKFACFVGVHFGRRSASALTEGVEIRFEGSMLATGDGQWFPLAAWKTNNAAVESEAVTGTPAAGQKVITVASTTNLTVYRRIFINNPTIGNSEFAIIKTFTSNTSITIEDDLAFSQNGATIYNDAEFLSAYVDLAAVKRVRLVVNAGNAGQNVAVEAYLNTFDSINS